jgi:hypothetical protein
MIRNIISKINFDTAYKYSIIGHTFAGTMAGIYITYKDTQYTTEPYYRMDRLLDATVAGVVGAGVGYVVGATSIVLYPIATISYICITIGDKINK